LADPNDPRSLSDDFIVGIYEDDDGFLWIGTSGGLNKYDPRADSFTRYGEVDGLSSDVVYGILEDENDNLWLSSNNGLFRFNMQTEEFDNFGVQDGLQSREFNAFAYHKTRDGQMLFGGINGLNAFYPDRIPPPNPYIPSIVLTMFTQGGDELSPGRSPSGLRDITLKWPRNYFEFEFASLSFAQSEENRYAYRLEGLDEDWIDMGTRGYGRYTNLPGGTYRLKLIGSNNDDVWNQNGSSLNITVIPPFWKTWLFRIIVFVVLVGGIAVLFSERIRRVEALNRTLESLVTQRTAELTVRVSAEAVTKERNRLARELHDSVTQSLHGSTLLAEAGQRLLKSGDIDRAGGYMARLGEVSRQALREMRLLIYELRPIALREVGLEKALRQRIEAVEQRADLVVQLSVEREINLPEAVEDAFFRIAQEAMNNALKHAKSSSVTVSIKIEDINESRCVILEVVDNGVGFDRDSVIDKGGVGLESMRERTENLGGELMVTSAPGDGTSLKATICL
jgi:signal transduction histidine kinase